MSTRVLEQTLPDEGFTQQQFDILVSPFLGWKGLEKHHNLLRIISFLSFLPVALLFKRSSTHLEIHLHQLVRPFDKESCTHIHMESREALLLSLVWLLVLASAAVLPEESIPNMYPTFGWCFGRSFPA